MRCLDYIFFMISKALLGVVAIGGGNGRMEDSVRRRLGERARLASWRGRDTRALQSKRRDGASTFPNRIRRDAGCRLRGAGTPRSFFLLPFAIAPGPMPDVVGQPSMRGISLHAADP
ncbi:hypothetical protein AW736_02725 [Termitidicoccus mucosus]|uniref:Uncharacterized protein n=1 Tax=Termitidicoccus mucosus TaxID=1184151 RepID=A0A178IQB7_9BACT|nr:hypothetical protein AW736_02725 [Opitutaceae bacterium TSB47]